MIAALVSSFNRKSKTINCIESLLKYSFIKIYLFDDGSTDGTLEEIMSNFPEVVIFKSKNDMYWSRSMSLLMEMSFLDGFKYFLLINDDVVFHSNIIDKFLGLYNEISLNGLHILVGATQSAKNHELTYSGMVRNSLTNPLNFKRKELSSHLSEVETFNGNCVIFSRGVIEEIGYIDKLFSHGLGDFDYGLRAKSMGIKIYLAPFYIGFCERNSTKNTNLDEKLPIKKRIEFVFSRKGIPIYDFIVYSRRHGGRFWLINYIRTYLVVIYRSIEVGCK